MEMMEAHCEKYLNPLGTVNRRALLLVKQYVDENLYLGAGEVRLVYQRHQQAHVDSFFITTYTIHNYYTLSNLEIFQNNTNQWFV